MLLKPTYKIKSVLDLEVDFLKKENIKTLIFDADSTLIHAKSYSIENKMLDKLIKIENSGVEIFIASNGKVARINKVFENHPIKAYPMCLKPLPFKINKLLKNYDKATTALVGDQLFTDILCANLSKIRSFMTSPYGDDKGFFMNIKRKLEKKILGGDN